MGNTIKNMNRNSSVLQIILYYDELELCNPLGSRRKKHKIGILSLYFGLSVSSSYCRCILLHARQFTAKNEV